MAQKNKIPTIVARQLEEKAANLPHLQHSDLHGRPMFKRVRKGGAELLREFPKATDEFDRPLVAQQYYWRDEPVLVDHTKALRKKFVEGGMEAVDAYCQEVRDFFDGSIKKRSRIGALLVWLKLKIVTPFLRWKHPLVEQAEILATRNKSEDTSNNLNTQI